MQSKNENEISLFHQIFCCQKEYFGEIALRGMLKKTRTCSQCITSKGNNLRSNLDFQMLNILLEVENHYNCLLFLEIIEIFRKFDKKGIQGIYY